MCRSMNVLIRTMAPAGRLSKLTVRVDENLHSIKGGGACQLREKVLAEAAETWVIVADYRKNSKVLGTNVSAPYLSTWSYGYAYLSQI